MDELFNFWQNVNLVLQSETTCCIIHPSYPTIQGVDFILRRVRMEFYSSFRWMNPPTSSNVFHSQARKRIKLLVLAPYNIDNVKREKGSSGTRDMPLIKARRTLVNILTERGDQKCKVLSYSPKLTVVEGSGMPILLITK